MRLVADAELEELLRDEPLRLREEADEDRALDERPPDELDRLDPLLDFPVLRRSAMSLPLVCSDSWLNSSRNVGLSHLTTRGDPTSQRARTGA
jgi:hypothetical protein